MLSRRGGDPRLDAHLLALTPADLIFIESLAPLLGNTPRRVKRFVNVTQLLLALPPYLDHNTQHPSDRNIVAFLAALNSGMPTLAASLFDLVEPNSTRTLSHIVVELTPNPPDKSDTLTDEHKKLTKWLSDKPDWALLPVKRLTTRLDVVRRLSFDRAMALSAT